MGPLLRFHTPMLAEYVKPQPAFQVGSSTAAVSPLPAAPVTTPTTGTELVKLAPVRGGPLPRGLILR